MTQSLYPSAREFGNYPSLPKVNSVKLPGRLTILFRNGTITSYPYHFISLVELTEGTKIVLCCTCGHMKNITIEGRNLKKVAKGISDQTLNEIKEDDHPEFCSLNKPVISRITLNKKPES